MTNKILFFLFFLLPFSLLAQVPQSINYQGIARLSGGVIANQAISVTIELLNSGGTPIFQEVHTPTTNAYGVFNISVGTVNAVGFSGINWTVPNRIRSTFSYSGQNVVTTDDLKSVPFAQLAQKAINADNAANAQYAADARNAIYTQNAIYAANINNVSNAGYNATQHIFNGSVLVNGGLEVNGIIEPNHSVAGHFWAYEGAANPSRAGTDILSLNDTRTTNIHLKSINILCNQIAVKSDYRIKSKIKQNDSFSSLDILKSISVKNYYYRDVIKNSNKQQKGFIAQEVEQVFPEAVSTTTEFIPNIYKIGKNIKTNDAEQTLTVTVDSLSDIKIGDKIRLISKAQNEVEVTAVEGTTLTVKGWTEKDTKEVFVYGKQVNDFRVVDYDRIFTLNVSATQALIQEVDALKEQVRKLETQNKALQKTNSALVKKFDTLDNRLTQLEHTTEQAVTPTPVSGQGSKTKPKR